MSDLEYNEQKGKHMGEAFTNQPETIDGGGPYEFDPEHEDMAGDTGADPAFETALKETQTEYREALDRLSDDPTPEEMDAMVDKAVSLITEHQAVNPKGSENKLNKRSILMNLHENDGVDGAFFVHLDEDGELTDATHMPLEIWDDLGRPDTITMVVYPRDMLN